MVYNRGVDELPPSPPPAPPVAPPSGSSYGAWGAFMLLAALAGSSATFFESRYVAAGCLVWAAASFGARWTQRRGMAAVSVVLFLGGLGGCGTIVLGRAAFTGFPLAGKVGRQTVGNLGSIRSALSVYYGDLEGAYPESLAPLTVDGKYLTAIPRAQVPGAHYATDAVASGREPDDAGGWLYNNVVGDANYGNILVNCTHTDFNGKAWNSY